MCILNLLIHYATHRSKRSVSSIERKYQKPCDCIDKGPKQDIRAQEIHISFPENKELRDHRNKTPSRLSFRGNVQVSHGKKHFQSQQ